MRNKCFVFGAHSRAQTLAVYLNSIEPDKVIEAYLVDDDEDNPNEIDGILVTHPKNVPAECRSYPVYLAIRGVNQTPVEERLRSLEFQQIIPVTVSFDAQLRKRFFRKLYAECGREYTMIDDLPSDVTLSGDRDQSVRIYEVCSIYDKPLEKDYYERANYEEPIQVGTALTDKRIPACRLFDDTGENISKHNKQLCEETALYWMWKNAMEDLIGLVHYRRHFIMPDDWTVRMTRNDIDVILPIPIYVKPSVEKNYRIRHISGDWDCLMKVLKDHSEDEYDFARKMFADNMYFPLNIFVMKREVMNDYCEWLFPRLFDVMKMVGSRKDAYQNRYPAFMAERLLTLYFEMHRDKYRIVYADKGFLQ